MILFYLLTYLIITYIINIEKRCSSTMNEGLKKRCSTAINEGLKKQKRVEYSTLFLHIIRSLSCQINLIYIP